MIRKSKTIILALGLLGLSSCYFWHDWTMCEVDDDCKCWTHYCTADQLCRARPGYPVCLLESGELPCPEGMSCSHECGVCMPSSVVDGQVDAGEINPDWTLERDADAGGDDLVEEEVDLVVEEVDLVEEEVDLVEEEVDLVEEEVDLVEEEVDLVEEVLDSELDEEEDVVDELLALGVECEFAIYCESGFCSRQGRCAPEGFEYIPAGTFVMGSPDGITEDPETGDVLPAEPGRTYPEGPVHLVTLTRPFFMSQHEVTRQDWVNRFEIFPASWGDDCGTKPGTQLNIYDAMAYCNALSDAEGLSRCYNNLEGCVFGDCQNCPDFEFSFPCDGYRLPTEAEWEYATRAEVQTAYSSGGASDEDYLECEDSFYSLAEIGWYCGNTDELQEVGLLMANRWGLYDTAGNAAELVGDFYSLYPSDHVIDPFHDSTGNDLPIARGGSYLDGAARLRSAARTPLESMYWCDDGISFRVARDVPEEL